MIGRAAQGDRQAERRQTGIDQVEQRRVFDREHLADPRIADIADRQARLQAIEAGVADKTRRREAQLIRIGLVLGVVDDDEIAAKRGEGDVQRARLGRRPARGRDDDVVARRQAERGDRRQGLAVAPLDHQFDVELRSGVIRYPGARATRNLAGVAYFSRHGRNPHSDDAPIKAR